MRYQNVVDGFHVSDIADVVIDYFENRHSLRLPTDRSRANMFAESIRRLIESDPTYRVIVITADVIREALVAVIHQSRSSTKTE